MVGSIVCRSADGLTRIVTVALPLLLPATVSLDGDTE